MGSGEEDYKHKRLSWYQQTQNKFKLKMLLFVIITNLLTIFYFTGPSLNWHHFNKYTQSLPLWDYSTTSIVDQLNTTQLELTSTRFQLTNLQQKLTSTNRLVEALILELTQLRKSGLTADHDQAAKDSTTDYSSMPEEVKLAVGPHKLPLGYTPRTGSDEVLPPVGGGCLKFLGELSLYMTYKVGGECPVDDTFAQRFMLKGCEPLPRRRCHPKSPTGYKEPTPLPASLWVTPPDTSIIWDPYPCKNYKCLVDRNKAPEFYDCKDCFDLKGRESTRWLIDNGGLDYGIDQVLSTRRHGTIRIGLDIGGGSGTFAARMKERNITIITTTMNLDGPFNSFIASRGLLSMHLSVSQRLPFFENTLDIVHSMHVLSNWIPDIMLEFTLYDIYRVLRPGGLFWLDHFFCLGSQLNATYVPMLDRVGFKKLRWNAGMKFDRGVDKNEWYFSALLEKPLTYNR